MNDKLHAEAGHLFANVKPAVVARSKWPTKKSEKEKKPKSMRRWSKYNSPGYNRPGNPFNGGDASSESEGSEEENANHNGWSHMGAGPLMRQYGMEAHNWPQHTEHSSFFGKRMHGSNEPSDTPGHNNRAWNKTKRRDEVLAMRAARKQKKLSKKKH